MRAGHLSCQWGGAGPPASLSSGVRYDPRQFVRHPVCTSLAVVLVVLTFGCNRKPPGALVAKALASTNVLFQAYQQEPITLSERGGETIKRVVKLFEDASHVEVRGEDNGPAPTGWFLLGDAHFFWIGSLLFLKDPHSQRYYVVQHPALGRMAHLYFEIEGQMRPAELSREQWLGVVAEL